MPSNFDDFDVLKDTNSILLKRTRVRQRKNTNLVANEEQNSK